MQLRIVAKYSATDAGVNHAASLLLKINVVQIRPGDCEPAAWSRLTTAVAAWYPTAMRPDHFSHLADSIIAGKQLDLDQALALSKVPDYDLPLLFAAASRVRHNFFGDRIALCSIVNAKSGLCAEDCAFCAQSSFHTTGAVTYPLLPQTTLLEGGRDAAVNGSACYGIVTSGTGISSGEELSRICAVVQQLTADGSVAPGASLGILDQQSLLALKEAGLVTYHHNLETARSYFPQICTTHAYEDDVATVRLAKQAGLRVCCGGLFGLGETMEQRIELAFTLRELQVDSVPINFLDPVAGTPLATVQQLTPLVCLHIISLYRLLLPDCHITVCGGRQSNLRELQSWIFLAGASGVMTGNYLTKEGRRPEDDHRLIADLGLTVTKEFVR